MSYQVQFKEKSSLHHYRTELPNILFDMGLDVYAFKAYCVLKNISGEKGVCVESNEFLCEKIGCQKKKFISIKKELVSKGLIKIEKRFRDDGATISDRITLLDISHVKSEG